MITISQGGRIRTVGTKLTTTDATAIYAPDDGTRPILAAINVSNNDAGAVTVTLVHYKAADSATYDIVNAKSIATHDRLIIDDLPIALEDGDEIRATAGTASKLEVLVTAIESQGAFRAGR